MGEVESRYWDHGDYTRFPPLDGCDCGACTLARLVRRQAELLDHCHAAIAALPQDVFGIGESSGDEAHRSHWYIRDELLGSIEAIGKEDEQRERRDQEDG
jgi:hypothetical protein